MQTLTPIQHAPSAGTPAPPRSDFSGRDFLRGLGYAEQLAVVTPSARSGGPGDVQMHEPEGGAGKKRPAEIMTAFGGTTAVYGDEKLTKRVKALKPGRQLRVIARKTVKRGRKELEVAQVEVMSGPQATTEPGQQGLIGWVETGRTVEGDEGSKFPFPKRIAVVLFQGQDIRQSGGDHDTSKKDSAERWTFFATATKQAKSLGAVFVNPRTAADPKSARFTLGLPIEFHTGEDIVNALAAIASASNGQLAEIHFHGHSGPTGVFGAQHAKSQGLYEDKSDNEDPKAKTLSDLNAAGVAKAIASDATIVLHGCGVASDSPEATGNTGVDTSLAGLKKAGAPPADRALVAKEVAKVEAALDNSITSAKRDPGFAEELTALLVRAGKSNVKVAGHKGSYNAWCDTRWTVFTARAITVEQERFDALSKAVKERDAALEREYKFGALLDNIKDAKVELKKLHPQWRRPLLAMFQRKQTEYRKKKKAAESEVAKANKRTRVEGSEIRSIEGSETRSDGKVDIKLVLGSVAPSKTYKAR